MPTKRDLQDQRNEMAHTALVLKGENSDLERKMSDIGKALSIIEADLERKIRFDEEDNAEVGSERTERLERGIELAMTRIGTLEDLLADRPAARLDWLQKCDLDFGVYLWKERSGE